MATCTVKMRDDRGSRKTTEIDAETLNEAKRLAESVAEHWVGDGEGVAVDECVAVTVFWTVIDDDGNKVWEDSAVIEIDGNIQVH